jgi:hypothetical protein
LHDFLLFVGTKINDYKLCRQNDLVFFTTKQAMHKSKSQPTNPTASPSTWAGAELAGFQIRKFNQICDASLIKLCYSFTERKIPVSFFRF